MYLLQEKFEALRENKAHVYNNWLKKRKVTLAFTSTNHMWADFLTKALVRTNLKLIVKM